MSKDNDIFKSKQSRCRFHRSELDFKKMFDANSITHKCIRAGLGSVKRDITEEECENCEYFKSRFIEYPISVTEIDVKQDDRNDRLYKSSIGKLARVRPCDQEYGDKTYIGIFLGDIPQSPHISHDPETGVLHISPYHNPAIFVPELKRIIFGIESWWSIIENDEDLDKDITDELIQNQWYVQIARVMERSLNNN